jgi:hypothetical protein
MTFVSSPPPAASFSSRPRETLARCWAAAGTAQARLVRVRPITTASEERRIVRMCEVMDAREQADNEFG